MPTLDRYEQKVFNDLTSKGMTQDQELKVLINNVEGDFSQLSEGLKQYAYSIGESEF